MSWGKFKMAPAKRVKRCDMSTSEFTTIDAFFVNVNKSSFPVDVPVASSRDATVLSPTAGTLQSPSAIVVNFVGTTIGSSVLNSSGRQTTND